MSRTKPRLVAIATYTYRGSVKPLGHDSLDDNLFEDGTTGYFLSEDRTNTKLQIYQLSADFLSVASLVATVPQYEAPAVAKGGGSYFLFGLAVRVDTGAVAGADVGGG